MDPASEALASNGHVQTNVNTHKQAIKYFVLFLIFAMLLYLAVTNMYDAQEASELRLKNEELRLQNEKFQVQLTENTELLDKHTQDGALFFNHALLVAQAYVSDENTVLSDDLFLDFNNRYLSNMLNRSEDLNAIVWQWSLCLEAANTAKEQNLTNTYNYLMQECAIINNIIMITYFEETYQRYESHWMFENVNFSELIVAINKIKASEIEIAEIEITANSG